MIGRLVGVYLKAYAKVIQMIRLRNLKTDLTSVKKNSWIGLHVKVTNSEIGLFNQINKDCIFDRVITGNFCQFAQNVTIAPRNHVYSNFTIHDFPYYHNISEIKNPSLWDQKYIVKIGHDVWVGCHAIILPGVEIGNGAIVAAGSVVTKSVPPYAIVAGNPAKVIKFRFSDSVINELEKEEWYLLSIPEIMKNLEKLQAIVNFDCDTWKNMNSVQKPFLKI